MRPYNSYRNPELSQPVSSVENTLTDRTLNSNAPFDVLRSLSESISVDCGSFEISAPSEYYQPSSAPSQVAFVDPKDREFQTPVESVPVTPVKNEPTKITQTPDRVGSQLEAGSAAADRAFGNKTLSSCPRGFEPQKSSVSAVTDMDDDDYDCMNDPNYGAPSEKNTSSPSFEELMARTAEGLAKMREETEAAENSSASRPQSVSKPQVRAEVVESAPKPEKSIDSKSESTAKKGFLASINWDKTRKTLFSREAIKLAFLSIAVSGLIISAVLYKNSSRNNGLLESDDVVMDQTSPEIQDVPVQGNETADVNNGFNAADNGDYWGQTDNNWNDADASNRHAMTDSFQDDYQSPMFDANQYSQDDLNEFPNPEDAGRQLASPHNSNNGNQFVETIPAYNPGPKYAEVAPAIGAQYSPDEYESPVLEDDTASGYSETGYNSNFMR